MQSWERELVCGWEFAILYLLLQPTEQMTQLERKLQTPNQEHSFSLLYSLTFWLEEHKGKE